MASEPDVQDLLNTITAAEGKYSRALERLKAELEFASQLAQARAEKTREWEALLQQAASLVAEGLKAGVTDIESLVCEAEALLAPLGQAAKEYTIYCCGHAHIDMNWMWTWPETVAVIHDTFITMDELMDEFPEFHFSQSQASVYHAMQQYAPETFERIKQRIAERRWEITGSQWVEGDKNMASGEILCRHLLYTRRWFKETMGIDYQQVKIDWECDTFGHCWTLPGILTRGGVTRYYHHRNSPERFRDTRAGEASLLFWWQGKDGSRVLAFDDSSSPGAYNNEIGPQMADRLFDLERYTGLKLMLWIYGVGDHGGGPTRRHLRVAQEMQTWPIWPQVKLTTTDDFFSAVEEQIEQQSLELPVHNGELNCVFEACYTSQSRIKFANRKGENALVEAEAIALLAHRLGEVPYPTAALAESWQRAMFLQFHDILPGSGVRDTYDHAMGLFQETLANTGMIKTRGLRALARHVDTSALAPIPRPGATDMGLGAGVGNEAWWGDVSTLGTGESGGDPFLIFNPAPFVRDEVIQLRIWDRDLEVGSIVVRSSKGNTTTGQVMANGNYWGHSFTDVAFVAKALPALGYRAYTVESGKAEAKEAAYARQVGRPVYGLQYVHAQLAKPVAMGNEYLEMTICPEAGGIVSLLDKQTGREFAAEGCVLGMLEREQEAPHDMTAWELGAIIDRTEPLAGSVLQIAHEGPHLAAVKLTAKHNNSEYELTISLAAGSRQIDFALDVNWLERGDPQTGVPVLRTSFPLAIEEGHATFEIACGTIERPADGSEVPALSWGDLTGPAFASDSQLLGATLLNDSKYGYQATKNAIRLSLLRSSYDPDPLPELGRHQIRYALVPHVGEFDAGQAIYAAYGFNHACIPVGTTFHNGDLPPKASALEILTPNVMLSGLKKAEDSGALVVRLYEFAGKEIEARVRLSSLLADADSPAVETDLLEQPLPESSARMEGDMLVVNIPAFGIATVKVGD